MNATVRLTEELAHQLSSKGKILKWMQEHPGACKNTNHLLLAKTMGNDVRLSIGAVRANLKRMVDREMLMEYNRYGKQKYRDITINYFHKDIPGYILENAPEDTKQKVNEYRQLADGEYLDDKGIKTRKLEQTDDSPSFIKLKRWPDTLNKLYELIREHPEECKTYPARFAKMHYTSLGYSQWVCCRNGLSTLKSAGLIEFIKDDSGRTLEIRATHPAMGVVAEDIVAAEEIIQPEQSETGLTSETDPLKVKELEKLNKAEPVEAPIEPATVKIEHTKDGLNLTITLNLNLNL